MEGRFLLTTYWARRLCWPPAGKFWIPGIQHFETLIFKIFDPNWLILNSFCRNSSFAGSGGLIIDSSRSGMCFSSCLTSSIYFSIRKSILLIWFSVFWCVYKPVPFPQICFWTLQYRKSTSSRMANRYTRIFDAGGTHGCVGREAKTHLGTIGLHLGARKPVGILHNVNLLKLQV